MTEKYSTAEAQKTVKVSQTSAKGEIKYEYSQLDWNTYSMRSLTYLLCWYNNEDVVPTQGAM